MICITCLKMYYCFLNVVIWQKRYLNALTKCLYWISKGKKYKKKYNIVKLSGLHLERWQFFRPWRQWRYIHCRCYDALIPPSEDSQCSRFVFALYQTYFLQWRWLWIYQHRWIQWRSSILILLHRKRNRKGSF